MKILYITRKHPPSIGGMQTQSAQFYKSLSRDNRVILISWTHSQVFLPFFAVFAFLKASKELLRNDIDIIQTGDLALSPLGLLLKFFFKKPVLSVSHGRDSAYHSVLYDYFVIRSAKKLDKIICVSNGIRRKLIGRGFSSGRLSVIPNGASISDSSNRISRGEGLRLVEKACNMRLEGRKVIFSASRLVPKKGIKEFIENAFSILNKKYPDLVFLIAGDGPEKPGILRTIGRMGLKDRVFLLGNIRHGSILHDALFSISDVFVMPNVKVGDDYEGFGVVVLEAGLSGIPVVAYNVDGINEALHDGQNGILIDGGNAASFADAVSLFLNDDNRRRDFSKKAEGYVKDNFDWSRIIARYTDEYRKLLTAG